MAGLAALGIALLHAVDVGRDLAQDRLRVHDARLYSNRPGIHDLTRVVQPLGQWWVLVVLATIAVLRPRLPRRSRHAAVVATVTVLVLATVSLTKIAIVHPVAQVVAGVPVGSFPSGHTADVTAILGTLLLVQVPLRLRLVPYAVALGTGAFVASSRVLSGAHTPDDVLAGWLLGASLVLAAGAWLTRADAPGSERDAEQRVDQPADLPGR